jgi:hypothetical protein
MPIVMKETFALAADLLYIAFSMIVFPLILVLDLVLLCIAFFRYYPLLRRRVARIHFHPIQSIHQYLLKHHLLVTRK